MRLKNKICVFSILTRWIIADVHCESRDMVSRVLHRVYDNLERSTLEERKKFYPVDYDLPNGPVVQKNLCPEGQFKDSMIEGEFDVEYCFWIFHMPALNNQSKEVLLDKDSRLVACNTVGDCYKGFNEQTISTCNYEDNDNDNDHHYEYYDYGDNYGNNYYSTRYRSYMKGLCVKSEGVAYQYSYMFSNLPPNTSIEEKNKFLPVRDENGKVKFCKNYVPCEKGQFCGYWDVFPDEQEYGKTVCYYDPVLPESNEGQLTKAEDDYEKNLIVCSSTLDCTCIRQSCGREIRRCYLNTGMKFVKFSRETKKRIIVDGICEKANPVALSFSDIYLNLSADVPYEARKKYFAFQGSYNNQPVECTNNKECRQLGSLFCGEVFDYETKRAKMFYGKLLFCFHDPILPDPNKDGELMIPSEHVKNEYGLPLCDTDLDCVCNDDSDSECFKELQRCSLVEGVKFVKYKYNEKKKHDDKIVYQGICVKAKPLAFLYYYKYVEVYHKNIPYDQSKNMFAVEFFDSNGAPFFQTCTKNSDCRKHGNMFCGSVLDYQHVKSPKKVSSSSNTKLMYCFQVPTPAPWDDNTPVELVVLEDEIGLVFCDFHSSSRCDPGESWICGGFMNIRSPIEDSDKDNSGVCLYDHPVAFTYSLIYRRLGQDVTYEERKKYYPVDDKENYTYSTPIKKCISNSECGDEQFCGYVWDSSTRLERRHFAHCFRPLKIPDFNGLARKVALVPEDIDVILCLTDSVCGVWRCDLEKSRLFLKEKEGQYYGLCLKDPPVAFLFSETYLQLDPNATYNEAEPYFSTKYKSLSDQCSNHANCEDDEFCGNMLDFSTKLPKNRFFCFKVPQFPNSNNGFLVVDKLSTNDFLLCNTSLDCSLDGLWRCHVEPGVIFAGKVEAERKVYSGMCVKAPPVALVFSQTYLNLNEDVPYDDKQKFFASDYAGPRQITTLKTCTTNKNCDEGQFCDQVLNFFNNLAKEGIMHCFSVPSIDAPFHESTKIATIPDESGLILCNGPTECGTDLFCNIETGQKYVKSKEGVNENVEYNGVCMKAEICQVNEHNEQFKWSYGTSPTNSKISCDSDVDCAGTQDTADSIFQSYCLLKKAFKNVNLCCHREIQPCKLGTLVGPGVRCGKNEGFKDGIFAECNGGLEKMGKQGEKADKWCDEGNNQCCQNPTNDKIQYCPDGQTPLFNEPKCQDYDENVPNSGKCIDKTGSICKNGHCCPDVKINDQGKLVRNKHSYITNHPCSPGIRPPQLPAGFCDPETRKVVVFGELSPLNEILQKWPEDGPKQCQKDSDCSTDNSTLCIYNEEPYCYYNPMKSLPSSYVWLIIILIVVGVIIIIAAIAGGTIWMLKKKEIILKPVKSSESQSVLTPIKSQISAQSVTVIKTPSGANLI